MATGTRTSIGTVAHRWPGVRRIAVLRGGGLGDLIFALPAVEALAAAYPEAELTLLGSPAHHALLGDRPHPTASPFVEVRVLPPHPGVQGGEPDPAATEAFWADLRRRRFDLGVQLHGGGRNSNPYLLELGTAHTVGTGTKDAARLERTLPYLYYQHEVLRGLEVAALAGAPAVMIEPRLRWTPTERAARVTRRDPPLVLVHPGAGDPRRRWPADRFAAVAGWLAADGAEVVVIGDAGEVELATEVAAAAGPGVTSRAGRLSLPELTRLCGRAALVVANDSGPRHVAAAMGAATVGIFWFGNVVNAAPLSRGRHRIQIGWATRCPVCGVDVTQVGWTAERCPHDESLVADVAVEDVLADARDLLGFAAVRVG